MNMHVFFFISLRQSYLDVTRYPDVLTKQLPPPSSLLNNCLNLYGTYNLWLRAGRGQDIP